MQELFRIFLNSVPTGLAQEAMNGLVIGKVGSGEVIIAQITQVELDRGERVQWVGLEDVFHAPIIPYMRATARTI